MISYEDYLQLLPKTELHCHFTSTMPAETFIRLAEKYDIRLWTTDPEELFDFADLADFLVGFRAGHDVLRAPEDFIEVAYEGVKAAVAEGNLRYREYFVNPQYFANRGVSYTQVIDPIIEGLRLAERDFGVGFRIVVAIARNESPQSAVELVEQIIANPRDEVVGLGLDDLTPEGTEDPARFADAYRLARKHGLRTTAHAGETDNTDPGAVLAALDVLGCERIDHGYRVVEDPALLERVRADGIGFTATPVSTTICSGWTLDPEHRIVSMIRAGLRVSISSDDALFFRTGVGREYREGLHAMGIRPAEARAVAMNGIDIAFCDDAYKAELRARFRAEMLGLDALVPEEWRMNAEV